VILAILQARMSSSRLPGKVLEPILGRPLILRTVDRISRASMLDEIVLATSVDPSDDPLVEVAERAGVNVRRGSLDDVLSRYLQVAEEIQPSTIVRLTGDNPLTDPAVIDWVVAEHQRTGADYTSNTIQRTYPRGLDVEAISVDALRRIGLKATDAAEREHVTIGIYRRPNEFTLHQVVQAPDRSNMRWTVDVAGDLAFVRAVFGALYPTNPNFGQDDVIALLERYPALSRTESQAEVEGSRHSRSR